jgi:metallo-beta-lactamase family protein
VGYQAAGTLGRRILEGAKQVYVFPHERHKVRCRVEMLDGFSAHADHDELLEWNKAVGHKAQAIFCTHGEEQGALALARDIHRELGVPVYVPEILDSVDLLRFALTSARP